MAGKNEVTLTFAGDADKLEKEIKRVSASTDDLESAFGRVGAAAKRSESSLGSVGQRSEKLNKIVGEGGRKFGDYGDGLGGVGDRFDEVDTRAMGVADGFAGLTDAMKWNQLTAQEQAMVFSDMGSAMYNAVIPSLQSGVKAVQNFVKNAGGMKSVLIGGGVVAGIGALAAGLKQLDENRAAKNVAELTEQLEESGAVSDDYAKKLVVIAEETGNFDKMLQQVAEVGGYQAAERLVEQAELLGANEESIAAMRGELSDLRGEYEESGAAIDGFNDALADQQAAQQALVDPLFGVLSATNDLAEAKASEAEAQATLNEALNGSDPAAIAEAQRGLEDAHLGVAEAAYGSTAAEETLMGALATGQTDVAEMRAQVDELERSGRLSGESAAYLRDQINSVESKGVTITADIWNATRDIGTVQQRLDSLKDKQVQIDIAYRSYGAAEANRARAMSSLYADGGVVYAAGGHPGMGRGTDTVPAWLTPGEMVLNEGQQANLFDAIDSGALGGGAPVQQNVTNVAVNVAGSIRSDRDLVKVIRDELARGGMRGALA